MASGGVFKPAATAPCTRSSFSEVGRNMQKVMQELRFKVFGALIAVRAVDGGWAAFRLGQDGKRRPAEFVVPDFIVEAEMAQFLADLFHESATPTNGDVVRIQ